MLLNDFYTIHELEPANDSLSCAIIFNKEHKIFKGHFPGQPVVPGVCMVQIVKELLERILSKSLLLTSTGQVKFLQLITPDVSPDVQISWKEQESSYEVTAVFRKDKDLFKLSGSFNETDKP